MNWLDGVIILLLASAVAHGVRVGLVRQTCAAAGLLGGLLLGAFLQNKLAHTSHTAQGRTAVAATVVWGCGLVLLAAASQLGMLMKTRLQARRIDAFDRTLGGIVGGATLLAVVWLGAAASANLPNNPLRQQIGSSRIVAILRRELPGAPPIVAKIGHLIEPNGFPQVFSGLEPRADTNVPLPSLGDLDTAVRADAASVVKIEGEGCGGMVEGSGFVAASDGIVATNAHVVAGVRQPAVLDGNGAHRAQVISFDPALDFAVLRVNGLTEPPLHFASQTATPGAPAAVLGYPGGGPFKVEPATVIDRFTALGTNIYNQGNTQRDVYSVRADVVPGNSGGPLIGQDGSVLGVVFAQSTTYAHVGYALTAGAPAQEIAYAQANGQAVSTGSCAD